MVWIHTYVSTEIREHPSSQTISTQPPDANIRDYNRPVRSTSGQQRLQTETVSENPGTCQKQIQETWHFENRISPFQNPTMSVWEKQRPATTVTHMSIARFPSRKSR